MTAKALAAPHDGVAPYDPPSWFVVLGLLGCTTLVSCWRPAREAMQVDPVLLLRDE